jgi:hypothetical protein
LLLGCALPVFADDSGAGKGCIDVQVGQARALAYDCLTQTLRGGDQRAAERLREQTDPAQQLRRRSPNQLGLATPAATSTRMGSGFGVSVVPQRP